VALSGIGLYLFARRTMNPTVAIAVGWHIVGGTLLFVPLLWQGFKRTGVWECGSKSHAHTPTLPYSHTAFFTITLACVLTGLGFIVYAAAGNSVGRAQVVFLLHVGSGVAVTLWAGWRVLHFRFSTGLAPALLLLSGAAFAAYTYAAERYYRTLTATNAAQAGNPLFPAGTRLAEEDRWVEGPGPESCGEAGCHPDIVRQWQASGHARAEDNPFYRRALAYATERLGADGARWCQGCHSPLTLVGPDNPKSNIENRKSVTCFACHAMTHVPEPTGNGRAVYAAPPLYPFADSRQPTARWLHGFLLRVRPEPHRTALAGPNGGHSRSEMCVPCHRISVNLPQNRYKFLRYDDTWAEWQAGPYSGESIHTFATDIRPRDCVGCHMPPAKGRDITGEPHDHACPGGATQREQRTEQNRQNVLRVEIFALRRAQNGAQGGQERLDAPLSRVPAVVTAGQTAMVDVLVENVGIGHAFPTGVPDLRDAWLHLTISDAQGRVLLQSGTADSPSPPAIQNPKSKIQNSVAHRYGLLALDRAGRPLERGNLFDMVAPIYRRLIGPGEGDVARYRFVVPRGTGGTLRLTARLRYRPFHAAFVRWAQRGRLAATTLAEHTINLMVTGEQTGTAPPVAARYDDSRDAPRFYAYGAALFLQKDFARARRAFQRAASLAPNRAENLIALGRTYLEEGDLLSARAHLQRALALTPGSPSAQVWLARTYRFMGQYEDALTLLQPLSERFPRDRLLWLDMGLCRFQNGQYEEAARAFSRMLDIDPDDARGHFNLMRCYRRLRRVTEARREEAIFHSLQDDEPLTHTTAGYLRAHPADGREALLTHEHALNEESIFR